MYYTLFKNNTAAYYTYCYASCFLAYHEYLPMTPKRFQTEEAWGAWCWRDEASLSPQEMEMFHTSMRSGRNPKFGES